MLSKCVRPPNFPFIQDSLHHAKSAPSGPAQGQAEILLEAASVVFAILLAFAVEEWRQGRREQQFAERARTAVFVELRANRDELKKSLVAHEGTLRRLPQLARATAADTLADLELGVEVPELSTAAWRAAQASDAVTAIDYEWLLRVSPAYEIQEWYSRGQADLVQTLGELEEPSARWLRLFETRLLLNQQVGEHLARSYDALLQGSTAH